VRRWWRRSGLRRKRALDLALAVPAAIVLLPVGLAVAAAIRIDLGTPVLFRQRRPGVGGEVFEMVKFRTMRDATDAQGRPLPDAERLTRFGRWLRASSLDELPELVNVIRGEMSLVGPRPLLVEYLDVYTPEQARRHEMPPGVTGWAQVNGRNAIDWDRVFELDVWYVDHWSLRLDLRILWATVAAVLGRRGISEPGEATRSRFDATRRRD
jgi:lipopolysaccharide/colanic/teichoic acid biosynthesis glycosyltransferase